MMRYLIYSLFFFLSISKSYAQDEIVLKRTGEPLDYDLRILEVKNDSIYYMAFRKEKKLPLKEVNTYYIAKNNLWVDVTSMLDSTLITPNPNNKTEISHLRKDTIEIRKSLGPVFKQNGRPLKPKQILEIMQQQSNTAAYNEMLIAKKNIAIANVIGGIGGFMFGFPLGTAIGGGKPDWVIFGIGTALIAGSIPFSVAYSKHAIKAVKFYNSGLKPTTMRSSVNINFGLIGKRLEMKLIF